MKPAAPPDRRMPRPRVASSRNASAGASPHAVVEAARRVVSRVVRAGEAGPSVVDLARSVGVSDRTLERHVRRVIGRPVRDLIAQIRVERALVLVQTTDMPLVHVAAAVGLQSQGRLNELFRRLLRQTPGSLRAGSARTASGRAAASQSHWQGPGRARSGPRRRSRGA